MRRLPDDFAEAPASAPCRVYLDPRDSSIFALVDPQDYQWAAQWRWRWKFDKRGKKRYAQRSTSVAGVKCTLFLHKEIVRRARGEPPSPLHIIGDHANGDSLDCRRDNLDWATRSENNARRAFVRCSKGRFA